jgi:hypothetical protein
MSEVIIQKKTSKAEAWLLQENKDLLKRARNAEANFKIVLEALVNSVNSTTRLVKIVEEQWDKKATAKGTSTSHRTS